MSREPRQFERLEAELEQRVLELGALARRSLDEAMTALLERSPRLAREVIERDRLLDALENDIDARCIDLFLLHQVVAGDLRLVRVGVKLAPELERIGDRAATIATRARELAEEPTQPPPISLIDLGARVGAMLEDALQALAARDSGLARQVIGQEDSIDSSLEALFRQLLSYMIEDPRRIRGALRYSIIAKNLEQIGDGAVEVAENVIYLIDGSDIRHRGERKSSSGD